MLATGKIKSRKLIPKTVFLTWRGSYKKVLRPEAIKSCTALLSAFNMIGTGKVYRFGTFKRQPQTTTDGGQELSCGNC